MVRPAAAPGQGTRTSLSSTSLNFNTYDLKKYWAQYHVFVISWKKVQLEGAVQHQTKPSESSFYLLPCFGEEASLICSPQTAPTQPTQSPAGSQAAHLTLGWTDIRLVQNSFWTCFSCSQAFPDTQHLLPGRRSKCQSLQDKHQHLDAPGWH